LLIPIPNTKEYIVTTDKNKDLFLGKEILFADGKKRTIRPLTIRNLRKFMKIVKDLKSEDNLSDEDIDVMVEAAAIALSAVDPELAADTDALEDALDLRCFGELMNAAMGSDPS
jgi:hypothetical protein